MNMLQLKSASQQMAPLEIAPGTLDTRSNVGVVVVNTSQSQSKYAHIFLNHVATRMAPKR